MKQKQTVTSNRILDILFEIIELASFVFTLRLDTMNMSQVSGAAFNTNCGTP